MLIPAICNNEACKTVWFTENILGGNINAVMTGCTVSPCPNCGGDGAIPDGEYSPLASNIFDLSQWKTVIDAIAKIRTSILAGASVADVREQIKNDATLTKFLSQFVPQNLKDIQTLLIIIGMVYAAYTYLTSGNVPDPKMALPKPAVELIESHDAISGSKSTIPSPHTNTQQPKAGAATEPSPQSKDNH